MSASQPRLSPRPPKRKRPRKGLGGRINTVPLLAPSVLVLFAWMAVPLAFTIYYSFRRFNLLNPMLHGWAGWSNYLFLIENRTLYAALLVTVEMTLAVLILTVCLGALFAAIFATDFPGSGVARLLMIAPFFVMPTVSALIWKNLLMDPVNGLISYLLRLVGLSPVAWFSQLPLLSLILVVSWEWLPFAFLILLTALQSLGEEQLEAARLDGAGPTAIFFHIQVPHMGRAISVVIMMETMFLLSIFAEILVTTNGGPGVATTNLAYLIYQRALLAFDVGGASAAGVIAIILANVMAIFLVQTVARGLDE